MTAFPYFLPSHLPLLLLSISPLSVLCRSALLESCIMPKQLTTKRKAEGPHHGPKAMPTKKLQKAFSQPALNSPRRPTSATDLSLSESPSPPSLTSGSSIEDSSSSTSMLQETRPNHGGAQETKELSWREFRTMSREQLKEYARSRGWKVRTWSAFTSTV